MFIRGINWVVKVITDGTDGAEGEPPAYCKRTRAG